MNGINAIRLDINTARFDSATTRKRIPPVEELKTSTQAEDKKKQFKNELKNEFNLSEEKSGSYSELLLSDRKYYRASLLNEFYNKMSGLDERTKPGHFVEYFA